MTGSAPTYSKRPWAEFRPSLVVFLAGLALLFGMDVVIWFRFGLNSSLYSYILLIPLVSGYFIWEKRLACRGDVTPAWGRAALIATGSVCATAALAGLARWDSHGELNHLRLGIMIGLLAGGSACWWGWAGWRARMFPVLFLFVMIPLSPGVEQALNEFLQRTSGWLAYHLIAATGTPVLRDGLYLILPNLNLLVAEECSGIRSTIVLLISAVITAHLFLRRGLPRVVFVSLVLPLGILRNAFRILFISMLTIHVDERIIHGPIHQHGGPFFFGLSLVVLLVALYWLRKWERSSNTHKLETDMSYTKKKKKEKKESHMKIKSLGVGILMLSITALLMGCTAQNAHERHFERGNSFFERERYAEAIVSYMNVLQRDPTHGEAIRQLGLSYHRSGELVRAYPLLLHAHYLEPDRTDLKILLARMNLSGGNAEEARFLAEEVIEQEPGNLDALVIMANASLTPEEVEKGLAMVEALHAEHSLEPRYYLALGALNMRKRDMKAAKEAFSEAIRLGPDVPEAYVARGDLYVLTGDQESAGADFQKAHSLAPLVSQTSLHLARFNRSTGQIEKARKLLNQMLAESPAFLPARYELAVIDAEAERLDESLGQLNEILTANPDHLSSLLLRARIWLLQGRLDDAEKSLENMVRIFPRSPAVRVEMARLMLRKGQQSRAVFELQETLRLAPYHMEATLALAETEIHAGRYSAAIARLTPFTEPGSPIRVPALMLIGTSLRLNGDWDQTLKLYDELATIIPQSPEPAFQMGITYQAAGRLEEAATAFHKAIAIDPAFVPGLARLADVEVEQGRYEQALAHVEQQIELIPDNAGLHYVRATVATRRSNWEVVESSLLKAVELQPKLASAYRDLGRLYVQQGRIEEALDKFNAALGVNAHDTASLMMMGVLYEQENHVPHAMQTYEKIIRINPDFAAALNNLAFLLANHETDIDRALELAQRARSLAPKDPAIADTLGLVALKKKDYRWAQSLFEESLRQISDDPTIWYNLALARHGLGIEEPARDALIQALAIDRDFPGRDQARLLKGILDIPLRGFSTAEADKIEDASQHMPDNPSVLVRLAALNEQEGHRSEAYELNKKALSISADFLPALVKLIGLEEQAERAIAYGRRARELAPDNPEVAHALGLAAFRAADYPWSRSLLAEAAAMRPADAAIQFDLAKASLMMSRVEDSRYAAERALTAGAKDEDRTAISEFLELLAIYESQEVSETASEILETARTSQPDAPLMQLVAARIASGDASKRAYKDIISRHPSWSLPVRDLAVIRVGEGLDDEETMQLAQAARTRLPSDPGALRSYALVLAYRGSAPQAVPLLRMVVDRNATDSLALYWLAKSVATTGAMPEATEIMQRAIQAGLPAPLEHSATNFFASVAESAK